MMTDFVRVSGLNDADAFERRLAERFPAIAQEIDDFERGLLHLEMAVFARATSAEIDRRNFEEVRAFQFVDELFASAGPELENAIYVSYLENVFIGPADPPYVFARSMPSEPIRIALIELEEHWQNITEPMKNRKPDCAR
jgi:hypothetical protein